MKKTTKTTARREKKTTTTMANVGDAATANTTQDYEGETCNYPHQSHVNETTTTYCLGSLQDREMIVTNEGVKISSRSEPHKQVELTTNRWAWLKALLPLIDQEAKELNRKTRPVAYRQHIGDGYYVSVNNGVMCVDIRKFFLPYGIEPGNERPTKRGISLRLEEWADFLSIVPVVQLIFPGLMNSTPCYEQNDHLGQLGYFGCTSCNPFDVTNRLPLL